MFITCFIEFLLTFDMKNVSEKPNLSCDYDLAFGTKMSRYKQQQKKNVCFLGTYIWTLVNR